VPLALEFSDHLGFLVRQDLGFDAIDTQLLGDRLCGRPIIAREHDDRQPRLVERADRGPRGFLDRIGDPEEPGEPPVDSDEHRSAALCPVRLGGLRHRACFNAFIVHERRRTDRDSGAVDFRDDALAGDAFE